jgi:hypothetical protein
MRLVRPKKFEELKRLRGLPVSKTKGKALSSKKLYKRLNAGINLLTTISLALVTLICSSSPSQANDPGLFTLSIHTANSWVGIDKNYSLWAASINRDKVSVNTYRRNKLEQRDIDILKRFIVTKGVMQYGKDNENLTNDQTDILTQEFPNNLTPEVKLAKSIHITLWRGSEEKNAILINTPTAKKKWPEDIKYLLKLIARLTKEARPIECQGIGFLQSLEYEKETHTTWAQWAKSLNGNKEFHNLNEKEIETLPSNLKQMVQYPGFLVALTEEDLFLMTSLGWSTPIPKTGPERSENLRDRPLSIYDIWWGVIEYNKKLYGINAWKIIEQKQ